MGVLALLPRPCGGGFLFGCGARQALCGRCFKMLVLCSRRVDEVENKKFKTSWQCEVLVKYDWGCCKATMRLSDVKQHRISFAFDPFSVGGACGFPVFSFMGVFFVEPCPFTAKKFLIFLQRYVIIKSTNQAI